MSVIEREKPQPVKPQDQGLSIRTNKLDDFQTSLLLYNYGLPIDAVLAAACTLPNGLAVNCKTKSITSESVDFAYDGTSGPRYDKSHIGSAVQFNLDEVGTFKGVIASQDNDGFQVKVDEGAKGALTSKLADLATSRGIKHDVALAGGPQITRLELKNKSCAYDDPIGVLRSGTIVNISPVDALIRARYVPPKPGIIAFRGPKRYGAEVADAFAIGFLVKFCTPIPARDFSEQMKFYDEL
jgi:hypothetical protein